MQRGQRRRADHALALPHSQRMLARLGRVVSEWRTSRHSGHRDGDGPSATGDAMALRPNARVAERRQLRRLLRRRRRRHPLRHRRDLAKHAPLRPPRTRPRPPRLRLRRRILTDLVVEYGGG